VTDEYERRSHWSTMTRHPRTLSSAPFTHPLIRRMFRRALVARRNVNEPPAIDRDSGTTAVLGQFRPRAAYRPCVLLPCLAERSWGLIDHGKQLNELGASDHTQSSPTGRIEKSASRKNLASIDLGKTHTVAV
jgi:hypothetical protein